MAVLLAVPALILLMFLVSRFYVPLVWFRQLGYGSVYLKPIVTRMLLLVVLAVPATFFLRTALHKPLDIWIREITAGPEPVTPLEQMRRQSMGHLLRRENLHFIWIPAVALAFLYALGLSRLHWMTLLEYLNRVSFGIEDPVFGLDLSFYAYRLPMYRALLGALMSLVVPVTFFTTLFSLITGLVRWNPRTNPRLQLHPDLSGWLALLLAGCFFLFAVSGGLGVFDMLSTQRGTVFGAGFTDLRAGIPLALIRSAVAILAGISVLAFRRIRNVRLLVAPLIVYAAVALAGQAVTGIVQYTVSNNEFQKERPYIAREMEFTRQAYGLDRIGSRPYDGTRVLTYEDMEDNRATLDNVRLNDPEPLAEVLAQQQGLRYYYRFHDIDVDRYRIDGQLREVLLSAREISQPALEERAGTFINLVMRYTHGFGAVATLANDMDRNGYARLLLKDTPPVSVHESLQVSEPRIYFGELTDDEAYGFQIVASKTGEFDFPQGDTNMETSYRGSGGLEITPLNRLMFSLYFGSPRFYFSREIGPDSRLMMIRNIRTRTETLFPFLSFDQDPYLVIRQDGSLYWMLDGYTTRSGLPYSRPYGELNYIRNSVKATVNAFTGAVTLYLFDEEDPVAATYGQIFPGLFLPSSEMPPDLREHVRYPEDLFRIQSQMLLNYHVEDPSVFYNKEDAWFVARKAQLEGTAQEVAPYYTLMALPDAADRSATEFMLSLPFTPASRGDQPRNNLVAWLTARCDGENYGELILYKLPKNAEIQGPLMIDSLIDQDTEISGKLSLWDKSGSRVVRGNLLTIPMDGGFLYVEPIYLKAQREGSSIPQMQAIVLATGRDLIMVETNELDEVIRQYFQEEIPIPDTPEDREPLPLPGDRARLEELIRQLRETLEELESLLEPDTALPGPSLPDPEVP